MVLNKSRHRNIWPLSYLTLALCYEFILHMIATKLPLNFNKSVFPSVILACKYDPCKSNVASFISSYAPIINEVKSSLRDTVGDAMLSTYLKYCLCLVPFSHILPFMVRYLFLFIRFTVSSAFLCMNLTVHLGWFL